MTEVIGGSYSFRPVRGETSTSGSIEAEVEHLQQRLKKAGVEIPLIALPDRLEFFAEHLAVAEQIAGDPKFNREAMSEFYVHVGPEVGTFPPPGSKTDEVARAPLHSALAPLQTRG